MPKVMKTGISHCTNKTQLQTVTIRLLLIIFSLSWAKMTSQFRWKLRTIAISPPRKITPIYIYICQSILPLFLGAFFSDSINGRSSSTPISLFDLSDSFLFFASWFFRHSSLPLIFGVKGALGGWVGG